MNPFLAGSLLLLSAGLILGVLETRINNRKKENGRGWRVGHVGRDQMYYEEIISGHWERIIIDGELLVGRAHHVIFFRSEKNWQLYPEWARNRREEIISRIQNEFREPEYLYHWA